MTVEGDGAGLALALGKDLLLDPFNHEVNEQLSVVSEKASQDFEGAANEATDENIRARVEVIHIERMMDTVEK